MSGLDEALAAANAKREEAAARRAKRAAESDTPEARLARAEREAANEVALADAEEAIGPIGTHLATVTTPSGALVIVRKPHPLVWKTARVEVQTKNEQKLEAAGAKLIRQCLVYPKGAAYEALVEEVPALPDTLIKLIAKLAGSELAEGE